MVRKIVLRIAFVALMQGLAFSQEQVPENHNKEILATKIGWYNPQKTDVEFALRTEVGAAGIPGGLFILYQCKEPEADFVPAREATLQDELNRMVKSKPDYTWSINQGVVNFYPKFFSSSPLDISLSEFEVENETAENAYAKLFASDGVKNALMRLGLHKPSLEVIVGSVGAPPNVGTVKVSPKVSKRISLHLNNTTLRDASNAIVATDGNKTWVLSVALCNGDYTYSAQLVN